MKILVVDDDQGLAFTLQLILEEEGHEVKSATGGSDGYTSYLCFRPDLVITDIQMPERNGLELIQHIRMHEPMVRAIYMSGNLAEYSLSLEEEKKRYPVGLLEKPFSRVELMKLLSEVA